MDNYSLRHIISMHMEGNNRVNKKGGSTCAERKSVALTTGIMHNALCFRKPSVSDDDYGKGIFLEVENCLS